MSEIQPSASPSFGGPVRLIAGEDTASYDDLLARMTATIKPTDVLEEVWVCDVVDLVWDTFRLRRLKASLLAGCPDKGLYEVLSVLDAESPYDTARMWLARDPAAVEWVQSTLAGAEMSMDTVMARTLSRTMDDIVRIDRMAMAAEVRRSATLRDIERHRAGFGRRLRGAADEAVELPAIENASAVAPA
jgi:hypothetical protein